MHPWFYLSLRHLHILLAHGRLSCSWRLPGVFRYHALQVHLDDLAFQDAEVALGAHLLLVRACWAYDTDRRVVDRELLVLLQGFTQCVETVRNELLECACIGEWAKHRERN